MTEQSGPHGTNGRRKSPRALFRAEVQFGHKGRRCRVSILDISLEGAKIRAIHKLQPGEEFWVSLPGLAPMPACVSWARDFVIGCTFAVPLHPAMFDGLLLGNVKEELPEPRKGARAGPSAHLLVV